MTGTAKLPTPKEYTAGGYRFIECSLCGARFNAGRGGNSAGMRWVAALKAEWWAKHTGIPQDRYALKLCEEDIPQLCPHLITPEAIERALGVKLYPWQVDYIFHGKDYPMDICPCVVFGSEKFEGARMSHNHGGGCYIRGRGTGHTFAYCIKLVLSQGEPLDMRKPEKFSDNKNKNYARTYFRRMLYYDVWLPLKEAGIPVRKMIGIN